MEGKWCLLDRSVVGLAVELLGFEQEWKCSMGLVGNLVWRLSQHDDVVVQQSTIGAQLLTNDRRGPSALVQSSMNASDR